MLIQHYRIFRTKGEQQKKRTANPTHAEEDLEKIHKCITRHHRALC